MFPDESFTQQPSNWLCKADSRDLSRARPSSRFYSNNKSASFSPTSGLFSPYCMELPGSYLSIRIYCVQQSQKGEEGGKHVSSLTVPFSETHAISVCSGGFCRCCVVRKLATCPTLSALRSLQFYAGKRACRRGRGGDRRGRGSSTHLH